ncbi:MAG: carbohydrate ABC transporter permease [Chloroflexota bacterium]
MVGSKQSHLSSTLLSLPVYLLALTMLIPYYWMVSGAFKPVPELVRNPPTFIVESPTFNNFYDPVGNTQPGHVEGLFQRFTDAPLRFGTFFLNSVVISSAITILSLLIASATAFVLAKYRLPGGNVLFIIILASMMVPWQVMFIPNFLTIRDLGWINTYWALIIPALPKAFVVFFLRQYMLSIPDELIDAGRIDGANDIRIWWQLVLPLVGPALAAMAIFVVINEWNNFVWPLIVVQDTAHATLPLALARLNSTLTGPQTMGVIMAGAFLASLPTLIVFLMFQRQFIEGVALTGVKG